MIDQKKKTKNNSLKKNIKKKLLINAKKQCEKHKFINEKLVADLD